MIQPGLRTAGGRAGAAARLLAAILLVVALAAPGWQRPAVAAPAAGGLSAEGHPHDALLPEAAAVLRAAPAGDTPFRPADPPALVPAAGEVPAAPDAGPVPDAPDAGGIRPARHPVRPASQGPPALV